MHPLVRDTKKTDIYRDVQKNIPEENMTNLKLFFACLVPLVPMRGGGHRHTVHIACRQPSSMVGQEPRNWMS